VAGQAASLRLSVIDASGVRVDNHFALSDDWREYAMDAVSLPAGFSTASIAVAGFDAGGVPSDVLVDDVSLKAPLAILTQPADVTVCLQGSFTLRVEVEAGANARFNWWRDGVRLAGATSSVFTVDNAALADAGRYRCEIADGCGNTQFSSAAVVTVSHRADFNSDGVVDFFDYLDFVQAFATGSNAADFNGDGAVDFFDYLGFVDAFATGC
jgi:hypothetical protein